MAELHDVDSMVLMQRASDLTLVFSSSCATDAEMDAAIIERADIRVELQRRDYEVRKQRGELYEWELDD